MKVIINGVETECEIKNAPKGVFAFAPSKEKVIDTEWYFFPRYVAFLRYGGNVLQCPIDSQLNEELVFEKTILRDKLFFGNFRSVLKFKIRCEYQYDELTPIEDIIEEIIDDFVSHDVRIDKRITKYIDDKAYLKEDFVKEYLKALEEYLKELNYETTTNKRAEP